MEYLLELYVSRGQSGELEAGLVEARASIEAMASQGLPVRLVRSISVPEDETCFLLYEAPSVDAVKDAARRAALPWTHIAEAVDGDPDRGALGSTGSSP